MSNHLENTLWLGIKQVLGRGSLVISSLFLARSLSVESFNAYSYFQMTATMLAGYAAFGFGIANTRYMAEINRPETEALPPIGLLWLLSIAATALVCLVALALPTSTFTGGLDLSKSLMVLGVVVLALNVVPESAAMGLEEFRGLAIASLLFAIVVGGGTLAAAGCGSHRVAAWGIVLAAVVKSLVESRVVASRAPLRRIARETRLSIDDARGILNRVGPLGLVTLLAATSSWVLGWLNLRFGVNDLQFAQFSVGIQWYALAMFLPNVAAQVALPRFVRIRGFASVTGSGEEVKFLAQVIAISFWSGAAIITVGFFASLWIRGLYGALFIDDQMLLGLYMLAALPYLVVNSIGSALLARDQQLYWLLATLIHQTSAIVSGFLLIEFGAAGSAFALLGSGVLFAAMAFHRARRLGLII